MNGLTNIITKINEQTELSCSSIVDEAKNYAQEILSNAKAQAETVAKNILDEASQKADVISSKAKSSSLLEYKRVILSKKAEIIDGIINDALDSLNGADDKVYFGYIESLVRKYAAEGEGLVVFGSKDLKRIPASFASTLSALVSDKASLKISEKAGDFEGGFVIEYPDMKIDCTFASLTEDSLDDIRDEISKVLFA